MSPDVLLAGAAIVLLASLVQGTLGFGFSIVALPFMALLMPSFMPQLLVLLSALTGGWVAWRDRHHIDWGLVAPLLPARSVGVVPGAALVAMLAPQALDVVFGAVGLLAVAAFVAPHVHVRSVATLVGTGVLSGAMGTATGLGGPSLVAVMGARSPEQQRSTLALTLAGGNVLSMVGLAVIGRMGSQDLLAAIALVVPLVVGLVISGVVVRRLPPAALKAAVVVTCVAASLLVLQRGITQW